MSHVNPSHSPSGINTLEIPSQFGIFVGIWGVLLIGTMILINGFDSLRDTFPDAISIWMKSWFLLGPIFAAAGVAHFTVKDVFLNMMPAKGTWGIWYLPGTIN